MIEFKDGDRVTYTGESNEVSTKSMIGLVGTVTEKGYNSSPSSLTKVEWDDESVNHYLYVYSGNLKLIETPKTTALEIAQSLVYGDRGAEYGHPKHDYDRTAQMWDAILASKLKDGEELTAKDALLMMVAVKISRLVNTPGHKDSIIDIAGYAECYDRVRRYEEGDTNS